MTIFNDEVAWLCSYFHQGSDFSLVIVSADPDQVLAQMSAVLTDFRIEGWYAGRLDISNDLEAALEEAGELKPPEAYLGWVENQATRLN